MGEAEYCVAETDETGRGEPVTATWVPRSMHRGCFRDRLTLWFENSVKFVLDP